MIQFWQYEKCSTCRKAKKWLDAHGVEYRSISIVDNPPSKTLLKKIWKLSELPLRKLFNTSGVSYRQGKFGERLKTMSDDDALDALCSDGKLIKRPLLFSDDVAFVGFNEAAYASVLES